MLDNYLLILFSCDECGKWFKTRKILRGHLMTVHSEQRRFKCDQCDFAAKSGVVLSRHKRRIHDKELKHLCSLCGMKFFSAYKLKMHTEKRHMFGGKLQVAPEKTGGSGGRVEVPQIDPQTGEIHPHRCEKCKLNFDSAVALTSHNNKSHNPKQEKSKKACPDCNKEYHLNYLPEHQMMEHPTEEMLRSVECKCSQCFLQFVNAYELNEHFMTSHRDKLKSQLDCKLCDLKWASVTALKRHLAEVHQKIYPICEHCGKMFNRKIDCEIHRASNHPHQEDINQIECKCDICDIVYMSATELNDHLDSTHGLNNDFPCPECHKESEHKVEEDLKSVKWQSGSALKKHIAETHQQIRHVCSLCGHVSQYRSDLLKHMTTNCIMSKTSSYEAGNSHEPKVCDLCGETFKNLAAHKATFHSKSRMAEIAEATCDMCDKYFMVASDLNDHLEQSHQITKHLDCKSCTSKWSSVTALEKHTLENHNFAGYGCDTCGYVSKSVTYLTKHKNVVHNNIKDYSCHLCGKSFSDQHSLRRHIVRLHEDGGEFLCDRCDFKAVSQNYLDKHVNNVHLKINTFYCDQCPFKTHRKFNLTSHINMVHLKIRPFKCELCDMGFAYNRDRVKHMEKAH